MSGETDSLNWPECGCLYQPCWRMEINGLWPALSCWHAHIQSYWSLWQGNGGRCKWAFIGELQNIFIFLNSSAYSANCNLFFETDLWQKQTRQGQTLFLGRLLSGRNLLLFVSCMNDSWPVTFPKGSGRSFCRFGIRLGVGWPLDQRQEVLADTHRTSFRSDATAFHAWPQKELWTLYTPGKAIQHGSLKSRW